MALMTAEQAAEAGKDLDFAKVWAALMKTDAQIAETKALVAETTKSVKDLSDNIGGVNNTLGKLTEEMVAGRVLELFQDLDYAVTRAARNLKLYEGRKVLMEIDIFLENGDVVVAVEVKTSLSVKDVNGHIDCIERLRGYMDKRGDNRKIIGAVAGGIVPDNVLEYAQQKGFYVLAQNGESISLAERSQDFEAKKW